MNKKSHVNSKAWLCAVALGSFPLALAAQTCAPTGADPLDGFAKLDVTLYLDLPDPDPLSAALPIELTMVGKIINGETASISKTYCQIGIQRMIIDFAASVEGDAITDWVTRSVYVWNSAGEPIGWQLDQLGERGR
jgi:hypothetical protein